MQLAIDIDDREIASFIKTNNIDDIKDLIIEFLKKQVKTRKKKGKWAKVADEMRGTLSDKTVNYLNDCSKEIRSGFELRDLK